MKKHGIERLETSENTLYIYTTATKQGRLSEIDIKVLTTITTTI